MTETQVIRSAFARTSVWLHTSNTREEQARIYEQSISIRRVYCAPLTAIEALGN